MKTKLLAVALLCGLLCACSPRGAHMPKHRKKRHCDCPTFSENITSKPQNLKTF